MGMPPTKEHARVYGVYGEGCADGPESSEEIVFLF